MGYIGESKLQMLSPSGRSRIWDAGADGYARGEGVAALVLKTLSAAQRDENNIECIIRETTVNQDGRTKESLCEFFSENSSLGTVQFVS